MKTNKQNISTINLNKPFADCTGCNRPDHTAAADHRTVVAGCYGYRRTAGCCWQRRCSAGRLVTLCETLCVKRKHLLKV